MLKTIYYQIPLKIPYKEKAHQSMNSIVADCQRTPSLKGCVVLFPVGSSIAGLAGLTHVASLPLEGQRFMQ